MAAFSDLSRELVIQILCHLDCKSLLACASVRRGRLSSILRSSARPRSAIFYTISSATLWSCNTGLNCPFHGLTMESLATISLWRSAIASS